MRTRALYHRLVSRELAPEVLKLLKETIDGISLGSNVRVAAQGENYGQANKCATAMARMAWEKTKDWIPALKQIILFHSSQKK